MNQNKFPIECEEYEKEIDRLTIQKDYDGLLAYLKKVEVFSESHSTPEYAPIFYCLGTANSTLAGHFKAEGASQDANKYRKQSLYYQRKTLSMLDQFDNSNALLLCACTNYANDLDACGRVIEALRFYRKAISLNPRFGMAIGNYGRALSSYANLVNDSGHYCELHCYAYQAIKRALEVSDSNMHNQAIEFFQEMISEYEASPGKDQLLMPIKFEEYDLGDAAEQKYRKRCLRNHFFLNPLNDVIALETAFAHDPLTITQYTEYVDRDEVSDKSSGEPPRWFSMLNQLKEEYIYSRFLCYEGSEKIRELHYADKNVKLSLSSYDYVNYSIRLEQIKSAFKNLFSIFDQIGFVINEFWGLGFPEREADAARVFKCNKYPKDNIALMAIYWSYCEFSEKFGNADSASERDLKILRNALEHKFVKVHEYQDKEKLQIKEDGFYHISESELIRHTLRLLELVREWIMELVYAIGIEERKNGNRDNAVHLNVLDFDDEWKT
ncbi:MAG: hypothetical protein K2K70_07895 [Lachnospiraceae bacterium]|nr:hypothetical protein [Lachnospiraceae bacterium]